MAKLKKIIPILILVVLIILVIILFMIVKIKNKKEDYGEQIEIDVEGDVDTTRVSTLKTVDNESKFLAIKECVQKYFAYYTDIYNEEEYSLGEIIEEESSEEIATTEALYNLLDKDYIEYKKITRENIPQKFAKLTNVKVDINEMYVSQSDTTESAYFVGGRIREISSGNISNFILMLKVNETKKVFSVLLGDYIKEKYGSIENGKDINIEWDKKIEENKYNKYDFRIVNDESYCQELISKYKEEILYDREVAYAHLDDEYKKIKFKSLSEFEEYAKKNTYKNVILKLSKYKKNEYSDYTEYICVDQKDNYYIFHETSPFNYTMILDNYTIDLPEFVEKYNVASDGEKVGYNIQKLVDSINDGDYKYMYNKLNKTFKNNNYKTQAEFESFIKQNLYESNNVISGTYETSGDNYIYSLRISDKTGKQTGSKNMQIIMKLKEGTDFEVSFNMN